MKIIPGFHYEAKFHNNNNNNNLFTYIAPFNIYGMIKGALQSKKTNITIDNYNKNAIYNR